MEQQGDAELGARLRSTLGQQGRPTQPLDEDLVAGILARGVTGRRRRSLAIAGAGLAAVLPGDVHDAHGPDHGRPDL